MTDNVILEEIKQNRCKCGCGKVIPEGKDYVQGHYSKHKKQLRELAEKGAPSEDETEKINPQPTPEKQADDPQFILRVLSFELLAGRDDDLDLLAWYESEDGKRIPKMPVAIGIVYNNLTEERLPYYLINSTDGTLIPAPMLPGFIGMFTKYEVEKAEREAEMRQEDDNDGDKPADPIAVTVQEPENQPEESRIIVAPDQNAPEPKKKSTSFLGSIFSGKEKKKTKTTEAQEISQMLAKIQNNAAKST